MLNQKAKYKGNGKYTVRPVTIVRRSDIDADLTTKFGNNSDSSDSKANRATSLIKLN
jgi:hypothetical protein